ncbi:MAG: NADH-dependent [FeFe] hydrogenase, group A6 [Thermoanaerobacterales bacterium]|nr:NADH-dependent [FeFe] hydrogenase, group A6 [Thermoanaerobacterales bacterium]
MGKVALVIDRQTVEVDAGTTILEAAARIGIKIPTLCYLKGINEVGACRICVVEVEGRAEFVTSCNTPVEEGMVVRTNTPAVRAARRMTLELILSDHPMECLTCVRNGNCELQTLAARLNVRAVRVSGATHAALPPDDSGAGIVRDPRKCVFCGRCISVCRDVQDVGVITLQGCGFEAFIGPPVGLALADTRCVQCGQCALVCPTAAITEKDETDAVWAALADPEKHVVVQTAPATRVTIGDMFGLPPGTPVTGRMVAALRRLGFDAVFDTDFTADLTIMEEASELVKRLTEGGALPQLTSCSPGWIKYAEHFHPEILPHISSCKSPQQMFGAVAKTYYAEKKGLDPASIFVVSVMPCTAKKFEAARPEMDAAQRYWNNPEVSRDVDVVLTSRELGRMIRRAGIDFANLPDEEYDEPLGVSTGAAAIFGATGGVMEAALRTAYEVVTGRELQQINFEEVRGLEGIKEAVVPLKGIDLKVMVAHGLGNARKVMEKLKAGELKDYHFIEIMCCPGGCIGGGGQPIPTDTEVRANRIAGLYRVDAAMEYRKSHENPALKKLYEEFLEKPLGHRSHELLHTHYTARS